MKKPSREVVTTVVEAIGAVLVTSGVAAYSIPISVIILGVLMMIAGGLAG
jgi:hypothetical protein